MKKTLSFFLIFTMLFGILSSFSFAAEVDTPYSGGSGTEDDPYLISTPSDLYELSDNIKTDPLLYTKKYYYRLTSDITVKGDSISPVNTVNLKGKDCCVETEYTVQDVYEMYYQMGFEEFEKWYENVVSDMGHLYYGVKYYQRGYGHTYSNYIKLSSTRSIKDFLDRYYGNIDYYDANDYNPVFYRKASFTGTFDGNGHNIHMLSKGYLFGFLENGAEIKNLKISGECASLAYKVDSTSIISGCIVATDTTLAEAYQTWEATDYETFKIEGGAVANNYGTIENCANYGDGISGLVGYNWGDAINCANYGDIVPTGVGLGYMDRDLNSYLQNRDWYENYVTYPSAVAISGGRISIDYTNAGYSLNVNGYFTEEECMALGGNISVYREGGFDFEKYWIMVNDIPVLRLICESMKGDLNVDGKVNSIDSNLMKRYLCEAPGKSEYMYYVSADINSDGDINPIDSALIKVRFIGG